MFELRKCLVEAAETAQRKSRGVMRVGVVRRHLERAHEIVESPCRVLSHPRAIQPARNQRFRQLGMQRERLLDIRPGILCDARRAPAAVLKSYTCLGPQRVGDRELRVTLDRLAQQTLDVAQLHLLEILPTEQSQRLEISL